MLHRQLVQQREPALSRRSARRTSAELRVKSNFSSRINVIWVVQSRCKKYSDVPKPQITFISPPSTPLEGRIAIVTDAGLDAVDAAALLTNGAHADGEVVWF